MRDKVILGVTLSLVLLLTLVVYAFVDANRGPSTQSTDLAAATRAGRNLYAQYCMQCHGPLGEGCVGPALNRATWRPELPGGDANPDYDEAARDNLIKKTIERGRISNQPGMQMPAFGIRENGALNDEEIDDLISFIQHGDWSTVLESAPSANNLGEVVPSYPGFTDEGRLEEVRKLLLNKGCVNCHQLGKGGGLVGADLTDVGSRRTAEWLRKWIKDPKAVPAGERGPNLWLVGPTPTVPPPAGVQTTPAARPSPQIFPMNATYMPTIPLTDEELDLLVDYLSKARASAP